MVGRVGDCSPCAYALMTLIYFLFNIFRSTLTLTDRHRRPRLGTGEAFPGRSIIASITKLRAYARKTYLSKRLRRQGQTEGALTNTKISLVSILKNATFFNQSAVYQPYTASAHPVESACRSSLLLAIYRLIANIKWKYPNNLNS